MQLHEYAALDATGLAALIRDGQVTAVEVEAVAREAITRVNTDLNALTGALFEQSLTAEPGGVFGGVPFLVKDSGPFARGVPYAFGSRGIRGAVARNDHPLMTRFRAAGLVTLGQTTAPELGCNFATEALRYGVTRNPWALDRGPGGSSGGAAALVAAGAVPVAHANDAAGSIRVPASACGLVGLKPGRGVTPSGLGESPMVSEFALARTVRDAAGLLAAVTGGRYDASRDPGRLRIAVTTDAWSGTPVDPQVAAATIAVAQTLEWIGHTVTESSPAIEAEDIVEGEMLGIRAGGRQLLASPVDLSLLEAVSRRIVAEAAEPTGGVAAQERITATVDDFFADFDLLVTPTLAVLPPLHGVLDYNDPGYDVRGWLRRIFEIGPFTAAFNVSGHPAISLPLGESRDGLPIGVQLVAASGREELLLQVAAQLEQAMPWRDRQPSVFAG
ncbi:MAG: amidase family protein [Rhodoglobus sp.]